MRVFFLIFLFPIFLFSELNIVFVHIGHSIPGYVKTALKQARLFNANAAVYFLANETAISKMAFDLENIDIVSLESLEKSEAHRYFLEHSQHSKTSMDGFWQYTSERFFYLEDFVRQYELKNIFHLENDVMLYRDLEELLPIFLKHYPSIAATFDADARVIPGFVFFRDCRSLTDLVRYLCKAGLKQNDMQSLSSFRNSSRKEPIDFLPIIFPEYCEIKPLMNLVGKEPSKPNNYWKHFNEFNSIFDAAALGQYLGGISPRNTKKIVPGFINETCIFNPSFLKFEWLEDENGRKIPFIRNKNQLIQINNLHIHSKQLEKFTS